MCSSFKLLLVAAVLRKVDQGQERLNRRVAVEAADLQPNSPGTKPHLGSRVSVAALCEWAMTYSDNTAANLLIRSLGGPGGVTGFARALGDPTTRLDRWETALNEVGIGDPRDTTSPLAMVGDLHELLVGGALKPSSRERLIGWMVANRTGDERLRAGVPKTWRVGDKTGTWMPAGGVNDIGILWPPGRAPILASAYTVGSPGRIAERNAVLATMGRVVAAWAN